MIRLWQSDTAMKILVINAVILALLAPLSFGQNADEEKPKKVGLLKMIEQKKKRGLMLATVNNAKQLFYLLVEFDSDFGEFPSDATAKESKDLNAYTGKHSNDYLGQFIAGGYTKSEEIFYVPGASKTKKKPDSDTATKAKTLEAGECGFTYVAGMSTSSHSGRPLLCAPMTGKGTKFDPEPLGGRAVVLRIDGAVKTYEINENGDVVLPNGKKLFETGADTVWGENGFDQEMLKFPK